MSSSITWGLMPADVRRLILKREWENKIGLKARLLNHKPFPIRIGLKPPPGHLAIADIVHFQQFVKSWQIYPHQNFVQWETRSYRVLAEQKIPKFFILNSIKDLIKFIGSEAKERSQVWKENMAPLLALSDINKSKKNEASIYSVLVKNLDIIEGMRDCDSQLLAKLIKQLFPNMGTGKYIRELPLAGVDTKFLESYQILISEVLDALFDNGVSDAGGLLDWLGCLENPKGWLGIKPLCSSTKEKLGGFPILQLSSDVLIQYELPAANILIVENIQSGLGLPELHNTIAVFGGGKNVAWLRAEWLREKQVAYWGDLDTWGLSILNDVRSKLPNVTPIMMDIETLRLFEDRMAIEPVPVEHCPDLLSESEKQIFLSLKSGDFKSSRLEQERISSDYIILKLQDWLTSGELN